MDIPTPRIVVAATHLIVLALLPTGSSAQDAHHWTEQYGTEADLLGGAVIGSADDLSAVYYNPGAVALLERPSVLFNLEAFQFERITSTGIDGAAPSMKSFTGGTSPGVIAVALPRSWVRQTVLAVSYLYRRRMNADLTGLQVEPRPSTALPPGVVGRTEDIRLQQSMGEQWVGFTAARKLTSSLGLGLTTNVAIRNQSLGTSATDQRFTAAGELASSAGDVTVDYWHTRVLWKVGLQLDQGGWSLGLTTTTPSVGILGSGSIAMSQARTGDVAAVFPGQSTLSAAVAEEGLPTTIRSSWALGGGARARLGSRIDLHLSAEWFTAVDDHVVVQTQATTNVPDSTADFTAVHGLEGVLNAGVGIRYEISEERAVYLAFASDRSAARPPDADFVRTEIARWDLSHITTGASLDVLGTDLTIGLRYSWGAHAGRAIDPGLPGFSVEEETARPTVSSRRLKIVFGLSYQFGNL